MRPFVLVSLAKPGEPVVSSTAMVSVEDIEVLLALE
jgi:hypothetical protein